MGDQFKKHKWQCLPTMDKVDYITLLSFKTREVMTYLLAISIYISLRMMKIKEELVLFKALRKL
jgi:hypothetical protein